MFLYDILALADRFRHGNAVFVCNHGGRKAFAVLIVVVDIKLNARNPVAVLPVLLCQPDPAFGRLILYFDFIGFQVFRINDHFGGIVIVHKVNRNLGFLNLVLAPGQQRSDSDAVRIRCDHSNDFSVIASLMGGQAGNTGYSELRASQGLFGQLILFDDPDPSLNRRVCPADIRGFIRFYNYRIEFQQFRGITGWVRVFLHDVLSLAQRRGNCNTVCVGGHRPGKAGSVLVVVVDIKLNSLDRAAIQLVCFHQFDITLSRLVLDGNGIGFSVFIGFDDGRIMVIYKVCGNACFLHLVFAVCQPSGFCISVRVCGQNGHNFTDTGTVIGGWCGNPGHGKLRAGQRFFGELILFHDLDFPFDDRVRHVFRDNRVIGRYLNGIIAVINQVSFRGLNLMNVVIALFHHILPRGFTVPVSCQHRKLASIHHTDSSCVCAATFRHQFVFGSHKRNVLAVFLLDDLYGPDNRGILGGIGHSWTVDIHRYRAVVQLITGRS